MRFPYAVLVVAALGAVATAACSDAETGSPSAEPTPTAPSKKPDASAPVEPVEPSPVDPVTVNPTDGEGEPTPDELAVDPDQNATCKGPFNCRLPNPDTDGNRVTNPKNGTKDWPIEANTAIVDGIGGSRGTVSEATIQINYGQRKMLLGASHVYAFSVKTTNGTASSWVPESAVKQTLAAMPTVEARNPGKGDYDEVFTLTGGDPAIYGDAKVVPNSTSTNEAATDYLKRNGDVVNVLYALPGGGGVSNDTYPTGANLEFRRAKGVASVYVYLYTKGTDTVVGTQRFIYGHVKGRYGWVARDALSPAATKPGPALTFCCAKCTKRDVAHRVFQASDCTTSAKAYCAAEASRGDYEASSIGSCAE